jgi:putative ATPase
MPEAIDVAPVNLELRQLGHGRAHARVLRRLRPGLRRTAGSDGTRRYDRRNVRAKRATFRTVPTRTKRPHAGSAGLGPTGDTLFTAAARRDPEVAGSAGAKLGAGQVPLAERMRPRMLEGFVGQAHLLGDGGSPLAKAIAADRVRSMILWGPPGVGKTTLARIIAAQTKSHFVPFSAVLGSVADLRAIVAEARDRLAFHGERTIVFVDEIHRFNKAQQDAFLPHVEDGTITLIGATTENPSFAVISALLSRCKVFRLEPLGDTDLVRLLVRALHDDAHGLGSQLLSADEDALVAIARMARGDARRALSTLEIVADFLKTTGGDRVTLDAVSSAESHRPLLYDKTGEEHYNVVSAFIKSMRGSDPDAAVYWMMRMLEAGDDPLFVLRRMLIFASEDIGNADPRALLVANAADEAFRRVGMPEGMYPLAHTAIYLACAPKSNACNVAWHRAKALIEEKGALPVPMKLRNPVTPLMRGEGYGEGYKYAHDYDSAVVQGETYLPDVIADTVLYEPTDRGEEAKIKARIEALRATRK